MIVLTRMFDLVNGWTNRFKIIGYGKYLGSLSWEGVLTSYPKNPSPKILGGTTHPRLGAKSKC